MIHFPFPDDIRLENASLTTQQAIEVLLPLVNERRQNRIRQIVDQRSFGLQVVLDGLADRGNVAAVMRTAEGLGIAQIHLIEPRSRKVHLANRVSQGAEKWLEVARWDQPAPCAQALKSQGFQLVVTDLNATKAIGDLDLSLPTAIVFGNERTGASDVMRQAADHTVILPMAGFSQSFNISVAAAIALYHLRTHKYGQHLETHELNQNQAERLFAEYLKRGLGSAHRVLTAYAATLR